MISTTFRTFIDRQCELHPQIAEWWTDWTIGDETQFMVDPSGCEQCWRDLNTPMQQWVTPDGYTIHNLRIPRNANTDNPSYRDGPMRYPTGYWQYVGTTGWLWQAKKSKWVGFDFDSIANHGNGLDAEQLTEIRSRALSLPYVIARTSKSGKGIHLLVRLNPLVTTRSHTEHKALAKSVLDRMSRDCDFSFHGTVDCYGSILWHWAKGLTNESLRRIG